MKTHVCAGPVQGHGGHEEGHYEEVACGILAYVGAASQPSGKERGEAYADKCQDPAEDKRAHKALAYHGPCTFKIVGPHGMRHLNGETAGCGHPKASEEPEACGYKANRSSRRRPQMPHHCGVYVLHHDGGELGKDCGVTHGKAQLYLLPGGELPSAA